MKLRAALVATTALVSIALVMPVASQQAVQPPAGAVFGILPGTTSTVATVVMTMPNGTKVPIGVLNPATGSFAPTGLAGEAATARQNEANNASTAAAAQAKANAAFPAASAGAAASMGVGTTPGTVAAGNDNRIVGAVQSSTLGQPNGPAQLSSVGKLPYFVAQSIALSERASAGDNVINWTFNGTGSGANPGAIQSAVRMNIGSGGHTSNFVWSHLVNYYDSTWALSGETLPQNVAIVGQYIRSDGGTGTNYSADGAHIASQGWAADFIFNDVIPWGTPGYPAYPPALAAALGIEVDIAATGIDWNGTRTVISADCKGRNGDTTNFGSCATVYGGGDSGNTINGVRQTTVNDVLHTSYQVNHSVVDTVDNIVSPGARDIWLGNAGKIAVGAAGSTFLEKDAVTGALQFSQNGSLGFPSVTVGGSGYTHCKATLSGGGGGPVDLSCTVTNGAVSAVGFTNHFGAAAAGNDFTSPPTIAITGDGSGATATVAVVAKVSTPVGAGLAAQPYTTVIGGTYTMSAYMLGRLTAFTGSTASTITLPGYYYTTTRNGLITPFQNRGTAPVTIVSNTGSTLQHAPNNNVVLAPGDSALILLDTDNNWRPLTINRVLPKPPAYTVANLPTCNSTYQDSVAIATDATSPTYGGALTGGGSKRTPVYCDGAAWTSH